MSYAEWRRGAVQLSDKFYDAPEIVKAHDMEPGSIGLFVLSLHDIAKTTVFVETPCVPTYFIDEWITKGKLRPRKTKRALVEAGLWEELRRDGKGPVLAYIPQGEGRLWKFGPLRQPVSPRKRQRVIERDQRICGICQRRVDETEVLHIDHILPVSRGGGSGMSNLQVAHAACNLSKGARVE